MALSELSSVVAPGSDLVGLAGDSGAGVVWLRGEHDVSTVSTLSALLAQAIARDDADLVLDLSGVEFMSAATVGVLVRAREFLRPFSRSLQVQAPSTCARRILELCNLRDMLDDLPGSTPVSTVGGGSATVSSLDVIGHSDGRRLSVAVGEGS